MRIVNIDLGDRSYKILIQYGLLNKFENILFEFNQFKKLLIISQSPIYNLYGDLFELGKENLFIEPILISNHESAKSLEEVNNIYGEMIKRNCDRSTLLIGLGGGVVGDVTGYLAATYMRGLSYINIPTTLLSMVDSSIGGKTGVNLKEGKNLVGAIWQPKMVLSDLNLLNTLSNRDIRSGFSEIIKYSIILDKNFFIFLKTNLSKLTIENSDLLLEAITRCVSLKSEVVMADEFDQKLRKILNFGHTIGHALEKLYDYKLLNHGEAVAYGMIVEAKLSVKKLGLKVEVYNEIKKILLRLSLPTLKSFDANKLIETIKTDKKNIDGKVNFVLLKDFEKTVIYDAVESIDILDSIKEIEGIKIK